jgi:hypothetical protein
MQPLNISNERPSPAFQQSFWKYQGYYPRRIVDLGERIRYPSGSRDSLISIAYEQSFAAI